ncbi:MAG: hypothetical protein KatS3mg017_0958 [Fimbriimonadales bacterium]|nr:MAG: hypothetical protein KatS3mg017_0958 [Fimbriimonadales bacterium]
MYKVIQPLYTGELQVSGSPGDLLRQPDPAAPTFVNCRAYRMLLWTGVKTGNAPVQYIVRGGDQHGWRWIHTGAITNSARQWFRVVLKIPRRTERLRIEVSGATQVLKSKIVGVRG